MSGARASAPLRVGIISAAWGARAHLPAWRSLEGVEVVAICTSRPETAQAAAEQFGMARAFHDFREMAADPNIDLIDCGTRPPLRREMVLAALGRGKHVYNGIPFAKDLADAEEMAAARRRAGTVAAVDAFIQAVPALVRMKELVEEGWIGEVLSADAAFQLPLFTEAQVNVPTYAWFADPANGASAWRNLGSHVVNALVHLLGPVREVMTEQRIDLPVWPPLEPGGEPIAANVPDNATALLRFASGAAATLRTHWTTIAGEGFQLTVRGTRGRVEARSPGFPMAHDTLLTGTQDPAMGTSRMMPLEVPERLLRVPGSSARADRPETGMLPLAAIFASMRDAVAGRGQAAPDFEQALHVQRVIEAGVAAHERGCWQPVERFPQPA